LKLKHRPTAGSVLTMGRTRVATPGPHTVQMDPLRRVKYYFSIKFFVYCMFNEVALEAWLTIDSCYLIGWNQKKIPAGITV